MPGRSKDHTAMGPMGEPLTLDSLPPPNTSRWVARRKAQVVGAVQAGLLTVDEACKLYKLSVEEFVAWQRALYRFGVRGLQITHSQLLRMADDREQQKRVWARSKRPRWTTSHA
jgi:Protein of unknown function (DUF1153)